MKKERNILWVTFVILSVFIVVSSHFWCIASRSENQSVIVFTLFPAVFGCVVLRFKNFALHVVLILSEIYQIFLLLDSADLMTTVFEGIGTGPIYNITTVGYITVGICVLPLAISIITAILTKTENAVNIVSVLLTALFASVSSIVYFLLFGILTMHEVMLGLPGFVLFPIIVTIIEIKFIKKTKLKNKTNYYLPVLIIFIVGIVLLLIFRQDIPDLFRDLNPQPYILPNSEIL